MRTVAIVGFGSIGQRHLRVVQAILPDARIVVLRRPESRGGDDVPCGVTIVRHVDEALILKPDAAIIANPAPFHIEAARPFAEASAHLLIEKPLSTSLEGLKSLSGLCRKNGLVLQVGYCLRFSPVLAELQKQIAAGAIGDIQSITATVGQYLPDWRPRQDYRNTVSARAELGGGVLWELSHELDLALWLGGEAKTVKAEAENSGTLDVDVEDTAHLQLSFANDAQANIAMDMVSRPAQRNLVVNGSLGQAAWDGISGEAKIRLSQNGEWKGVQVKDADEPDAMYRQQFRHFIRCIEKGEPPGRRVVELVLAAKRSAEIGEAVSL